MSRSMKRVCVCTAALIGCATVWAQEEPVAAARGLLGRVLGPRAEGFAVAIIGQQDGLDVFEIDDDDGTVVLRGSNGVAIASALNHYLNHFCNASVSLCGRQLELPDPLPRVTTPVRIVTPFQYRYCFNYCCFSYSMAWYDWADWERIIDWMALHGIAMPLSVTGQEAVWRAVGARLGLSRADLDAFFVGPAYLPFGWMGCMDGWGGPLTEDWIDRHCALQQQIVARERALGMTPVLQGFTGHVPAGLKRVFPEAAFQELPSWCGFPVTTFVDPQDPLFLQVGKAFVEEQTSLFGTDHLYASDTFIEMSPPSDDPAFLDAMGKAVYGAMRSADPGAVWVMQGWLFVNNPKFWQPPQAKALLGSVPEDRMIVLDLHCESRPAWSKTEAFYGNPWVWCIIQDFGDVVSMHGGLPQINQGLSQAFESPQRGKLRGAGFIMEGLGYNPVVYDLLSGMLWRPEAVDLTDWAAGYARRRYGCDLPQAARAWRLLLDTVYRQPGRTGSIICGRPALFASASWTGGGVPYDPDDLVRAGELLVKCADALGVKEPFAYDLVHVTRQVLSNYAARAQCDVALAYESKDRGLLASASAHFFEIMEDLDTLLGTREEFLLGRWIADAQRWGTDDAQRRHYEWNARTQITLWGPRDGVLHDYANKQWSGMIRGFYLPRWKLFVEHLDAALEKDVAFDADAFGQAVRQWEEDWTHGTEGYLDHPQGDAVAVAKRLWAKYRAQLKEPEMHSLTTGKPVRCSASLPRYPPEYANDGRLHNVNQYWAVDTSMDPECWWQVDLETPTEVGRVVIVFYYGDRRSYECTVECSLDGESWDRVADYRGAPQRATRTGLTVEFPPRTTRFLRVTVTANTANTGRHLVEVMAYPE